MENMDTAPQSTATAASFLDRATGVFSSPGDTFQELSLAPVRATSWLIPLVMSLVITVVFVAAIFYNQTLRDQVIAQQMAEVQKKVADGQITQEQVDRMQEGMNSPVLFIAFGGISAVVVITIIFFVAGLALWLASILFLKFSGPYPKILEMYGLSSLIGFIGAVVTLIMMNLLGSVNAIPSGQILFMNSFDHHSWLHNTLGAINLFSLWQTYTVGIGLAKLSNKPNSTGLGLAFGLWALWEIIAVVLETAFGVRMR
ncbi:MAG TPA: YIP1 family protein [Bacteroidota bacterium]|nr:YIP1 family protein [Bacteroidota bacterium]